MTGDIEAFVRFTDPNMFRRIIEVEMKKGTRRAALIVVREIKKGMREGKFDKNASLTLALSKGTIPTLKEKNLADAITHKLINSFRAEVGIIKNSQSTGSAVGVKKSTINMEKLVTLMESGYTIRITPKMIFAIFAALSEREQAGDDSGEDFETRGKRFFRVPPRKILTAVLTDRRIDKMIQKEWRIALEKTFKRMGAKDGEWRDR